MNRDKRLGSLNRFIKSCISQLCIDRSVKSPTEIICEYRIIFVILRVEWLAQAINREPGENPGQSRCGEPHLD